ncbi:hypothetical protein Pcinc_014849 [Petrolisthes cinctipes]|uniref:Uncharacterized protein n=1 Tax=Petrolisthes cinctipes TaxID=88211 RepID=A0AAE1FU64_PETCI|nr:hypothetical protein Pcinc_014849 [Petrolisthes cinctipes]
MNYSGPASLVDVEADLALSDDFDITDKHWPPLALHSQHFGPTPWQPQVKVPYPASQASTSKRPMDQTLDTSESPSPAPKASRHIEISHSTAPDSSPPLPETYRSSPQAAHTPLAFAPRGDYVKVMFRDNPTVEI